jgi:hypothetical protein
LIALVGPALGALLRKEKDEASPSQTVFGAGSSNFLHSSFAKSGGFFIFKNLLASHWSLNQNRFVKNLFSRSKIERSAK